MFHTKKTENTSITTAQPILKVFTLMGHLSCIQTLTTFTLLIYNISYLFIYLFIYLLQEDVLEDLANSLRGLSSNENTPTKKVKVLKIEEDERKSTKKALFDDK